jgi:hypothetical protein
MQKGRNVFATVAFLLLSAGQIIGQSFFQGREVVFSATYGLGKVQYYSEHTPIYVGFADQEAVEYSPSWGFEVDKHFWMNERWDFKVGFSHLTVTEKSERLQAGSMCLPETIDRALSTSRQRSLGNLAQAST